ncbi:MAG: type II secretion system secretin GspD [Planctomycetota bacterium]
MTRKIALLIIAGLIMSSIVLASGKGLISSFSEQENQPPKEGVSINLAGAKMGTLLEYISRLLGKPLISDPAFPLEQPVNIISPPGISIPPEKLINVLESTLRMRGFTLLTSGTVIKVVKSAEARENPTIVTSREELEKLIESDQIVTHVIPLEQAQVGDVMKVLDPLKSREGSFLASPETNSIIVTEFATNIRRIYEVIKQIDRSPVKYQTEIKTLKHTSAKTLRQNLNEYIQAMTSVSKPQAGIQPRPFISIDERTNSIVIFALPEQLQQISSLVDALDAEVPEAVNKTYIYKLSNTNADEVAKIIESIFAKSLAPGERPPASILSEKSSNSLVIIAPPAIYREMEPLLKAIDIKKTQVLIEAAIVELSMDKMTELGIELSSMANAAGGEYKGFSDTDFDLSSKSATGKTPADSTGLTFGLWKETQGNIPLLLKAAQKDTGINVLAVPRLLTNDNSEATIDIADKIPYDTRTLGPDGTVTSVTFGGYLEAGIKLKIIPHISPDGYLRLEIEQSVEQFFETSYSDTRPAKATRTTKTVVTVPDKSTVIIGGLTKDDKSIQVSKVPLLGDIPLLGLLFRSTEEQVKKTNLCIFITPHIMKEFSELKEETGKHDEALERVKKAELGLSAPLKVNPKEKKDE